MNALRKILPDCQVCILRFGNSDEVQLERWSVRRGGLPTREVIETCDTKRPSIIILTGTGIITKRIADSQEIVLRIEDNPNEFYATRYSDGTIAFTKRSRTSSTIENLRSEGISIVGTECLTETMTVENAISECVEVAYGANVTFGAMFGSNDYTATVSRLLFNRIKLPVLVMILAVVAANAAYSGRLSERYAERHAQLVAAKKSAGTTDNLSRQKQQFIADYANVTPYPFAYICDRTGACRPEGIKFVRLAVSPLMKRIKHGKRPIIANNTVSIDGEARNNQSVNEFVAALRNERFSKEVELSSLGSDRNGNITFTITIRL